MLQADTLEVLMFKHIPVSVDGSELSHPTVKRACSFAREVDARVTFHPAKRTFPPQGIAPGGVPDYAGASEIFRAAMDRQSETILASARRA
jgi:nucleotide-binding universal stress UspA family protein